MGFRLGPEAAGNLINRLKQAMDEEQISADLILGGTPTVAKVAEESGISRRCSPAKNPWMKLCFLQGETVETKEENYPDNLVDGLNGNLLSHT